MIAPERRARDGERAFERRRRLVNLYVAWGKQDEAARYRALLRSSP